ncbi:peptidoglycan DD-metalloendopeptidase family protein [Rhodococcus sp. 24CO]|uniref:peptidoglycan DD-metalloendopeptidase family protein n=1 Tax=Rhodococcus sp. 24CO TaxID=3117460 RepID=UPI003D34AB34
MTKTRTRQPLFATRTKIVLSLLTAATTLALTACGGFAAQPVIKKSRCGTSSTSDRSPATLPGNTELKASGPITQPTKDGTTTFTSGFGHRWGTEHKGVDFAGEVGTPIYAALDGVAVKAGPASGFGNWIVLDSLVDDKPVSTVYGHMFDDGVLVKEGQQVTAGDHIANIGNNGQSTGAHLHFEYWEGGRLQGGTAVDPMIKLGGAPSPASEVGSNSPAIELVASSSSIDCAGFGVAGGGDLKAGSVPPEMEQWFRKAGSLCPQIKPSLLAADAKAESGLVRGRTSEIGAKGITQFMDHTFASYGRDDDGNGTTSIWDDGDAIMAQGRYFCAIAAQVDGWLADGSVTGDPKSLYIASYNAGEGAVKNAGGMPSGGDYTTQTQPYVAKVLAYEAEFAAPGGSGELVVSPRSASGAQVVEAARQYLGTPYVWGGGGIGGPTGGGFDCSGLTSYAIYTGSGNQVTLPRTSEQQWSVGVEIPIAQAQPGDLVFGSWSGSGPGHVGIAIGNGQMIHAPTTGDVVKQAPLQNDMKARRVI